MRVFLAVLVLIFSLQSWTRADDISDFEIEGISIGDSALDFFTESEIKDNIRKNQYEGSDGKFFDVLIKKNNFEIYKKITLSFKKNDKSYKIYSLGGLIYYDNDTERCNADYKKIADEVESLFPNHTKDLMVNTKHPQDPSGKSVLNGTLFIDNSGSGAEVSCYSWSEEINIEDYVLVAIDSAEFSNWLTDYYSN